MEVNFLREPFEHFIIKDIYSKTELEQVWQELDFIETSDYVKLPQARNTAVQQNGSPIAKRKCVFLANMFVNYQQTLKVYRHLSKLKKDETIRKEGILGKIFLDTNSASTLVSYYKEGDFYKSHYDSSVVTLMVHLWRGKREFTGGDLYFEEYDNYKYVPQNNCALIIPGSIKHGLDEIFSTDNNNTNTKRICISVFLNRGINVS